LGFRYNDDLKRNPTDTADVRPIPDPEVLNQAPTDARIVVHTDAGARIGSCNELPNPFTTSRGATVIVDDTAVIAALGTGGYAATEYLNSMLVEALARQVHLRSLRCCWGSGLQTASIGRRGRRAAQAVGEPISRASI
jgi:serine/threonine-protein kinase